MAGLRITPSSVSVVRNVAEHSILVIALLDVLRQITTGTGMRGLFTERAVKHGSALRLFSFFGQLCCKLRTLHPAFIQRHVHAGQRRAGHVGLATPRFAAQAGRKAERASPFCPSQADEAGFRYPPCLVPGQ